MNAKPIPISAARRIAEAYGYEQVVVIARRTGAEGVEHVTSYGINKVHCDVAGRIAGFLKHKIMEWPVDLAALLEEHGLKLFKTRNTRKNAGKTAELTLATALGITLDDTPSRTNELA